jgi:pyridoxine 5-phosphate synthase
MTNLSVNLNRVALLRNSRNIGIPSVITSARIVLEAGASGITVHPRPDQRHIRPDDVDDLAQLLADEFSSAEYNRDVGK